MSDHPPTPAARRGRRALAGAWLAALLGSALLPGALAPSAAVPPRAAPEQIAQLAFSPDGAFLAAAARDGATQLWDLGEEGAARPLGEPPHRSGAVAFSPAGGLLAVQNLAGALEFWDPEEGELQRSLGEEQPALQEILGAAQLRLVFSSDGSLIAAGGHTARVLPVQPGEFERRGFEVTGGVAVWEVASGELRWQRRLSGLPGALLAVRFQPEGESLLGASANGTLYEWDARGGERSRRDLPGEGWLTAAAFSPDATLVAGAGQRGAPLVWNVETARVERTLSDVGGRLHAVVFTGDGKTLLGGGSGGPAIHRWEPQSGRTLSPLPGGAGAVRLLAVANDGSRLAVATERSLIARTVSLWDLEAGQRLRILVGAPGE